MMGVMAMTVDLTRPPTPPPSYDAAVTWPNEIIGCPAYLPASSQR
jgi:hypothetical protein